ncbi:aspartic proteinase Mkc7p [Monosporozyma servazzii]
MAVFSKFITLSIFLTTINAIAVENPIEGRSKGYVGMKFKKRYGNNYDTATSNFKPEFNLHKRDGKYETVEITNEQSFYSVELEIGTPTQEVTVLVDTGSSDLWVMGSNNPYCKSSSNSQISTSDRIDCGEFGTFDSDKSSTWSRNESASRFSIQYGDTTFASGVWGQDRLHLEDLNITGLSFAVANRTNSTVGVLGVGLPGLETTNSGRNAYQYDNFPMVLKRAGATESTAYSLYLNSLQEEHGSILFGAVDNSKYSGPLYTIPLINTLRGYGYETPIQFDVTLQGIGLSDGDNNSTLTSTKVPALLDSGTTLTYLPKSLLDDLADKIGARYIERYGYYMVPCNSEGTSSSAFDDDTSLVFDFGGFHIRTPLKDYLVQALTNTCILGLIPQDSNGVILGDTFLTHAYVVYDLDNLEISMAQAKYIEDYDAEDYKSADIQTINSSVPGATKAPGYSSTWSTSASNTDSSGNIFTIHPHPTQINSVYSVETSGSTILVTNTASGSNQDSSSTSERSTSSSTGKNKNLAIPTFNNRSPLLEAITFMLTIFIPFNLL